ncbi:hypothetical protein SEUCBS139899_006090 [Sporothrix eucalyptigena]|uniref:Carboxylesterase family protein n=1 Tax=Sporothrix eucalyptigena TaxID=1812306 RepID=A0ABP0CB36_9PEZI
MAHQQDLRIQDVSVTGIENKSALKAKRTHFALPEEPSGGADELSSGLRVKHESFSELLSQSDIQDTIERHDAKNFDWILSLPRDAGDLAKSKQLRRICSAADFTDSASHRRKVYFGCNILRQRSLSRSSVTGSNREVNTYTLIATPLTSRAEVDDLRTSPQTMIDTIMPSAVSAPPPYTVDMLATELNGASPKAPAMSLDPIPLDRSQSLPRSPSSSVARIEDTLEELDRLEDQFEAVHRMVRINRMASPDKEVRDKMAPQPSTNGTKKPVAKTGTVRPRPNDLARTGSTRRSVGAAEPTKKPSEAASGSTAAATKRLSVARPLSLLPPRPPAKSSKPPTTSTFELPGEAVARRLKEQREARMQAAAAAAANSKSTPTNASQLRRARSVKPPTIPTFELPGEAISRRKREEHEAKIKQQEEEERKRREFKARPIRLSVTPSTVPRETISSRARTNRMSIMGDSAITGGGLSVPSTGPPGNRRLSVPSSDSGNAGGQRQVSRGRGQALGSPAAAGQISRATSTSTGSISGKRSTISMEDVQNQKLRGREILQRDSILSSDRDREKREREAIAKQARQDAAERSRALSREWAEKQKLRAKKATTARTEN